MTKNQKYLIITRPPYAQDVADYADCKEELLSVLQNLNFEDARYRTEVYAITEPLTTDELVAIQDQIDEDKEDLEQQAIMADPERRAQFYEDHPESIPDEWEDL